MFKHIFALSGLACAALAAPAQAVPTVASVIYDAVGGVQNGGDSFLSAGTFLLDRVQNTNAGLLQSVTLTMKVGAATAGTFKVVVCPISRVGLPVLHQCATVAIAPYAVLTQEAFSKITVTASSTIALAQNTAYFVGVAHNVGARSSLHLGNTLTQAVLNRPSVAAGASYYNNGGVQANSGGPYQIEVTTVPAP